MKVLKSPISPESKFLIYAIVFTIGCHGLAMFAMISMLLPGIPGGSHSLVVERIAYIVNNPVNWRLGWFPWQLTALSDLILSIALLRTKWIAKPFAWSALIFTLVALAFEQPAEYRWTTEGIDIARHTPSLYAAFEDQMFRLTSHWAALFYTIAAIFWSISLARANAWNAWMNGLSIVLWGLLLFVSIGPLALPSLSPNVVSAGNALGFNLMMLWFAGAFYMVKARPQDCQ